MRLKQPKPDLQIVEAKPTEAQPKQKKIHRRLFFGGCPPTGENPLR